MSGKSEKKLRKLARETIKVDYDRFIKEIWELEFWHRVNITMALIARTDQVGKGQLILWSFLAAIFIVAFIFGWICQVRLL